MIYGAYPPKIIVSGFAFLILGGLSYSASGSDVSILSSVGIFMMGLAIMILGYPYIFVIKRRTPVVFIARILGILLHLIISSIFFWQAFVRLWLVIMS